MRRREATLDTLIVNENISSADQLHLREYTTTSIKGHIAVGLSVPSKENVTRLEVHLTDNQLISTISGYRSPSLAFHDTLVTLERPKRTDVRVTALLSLLQCPRKTVHTWLSARTGRRGLPTLRGHNSSFVSIERRPKYILLGHLATCLLC